MEPCQGLPDRPCPELCCDSTVHWTIYDLFLCNHCERTRERLREDEINKLKSFPALGVKQAKSSKSSSGASKTDQLPGTSVSASPIIDEKLTNQISSSGAATSDLPAKRGTDNGGNGCAECCPHCLIQLTGKRQVKCDVCSCSYHQKCTGMTSKVFDKLITSFAEVGWVCSDCKDAARSSFRRMETAISKMAEELAIVTSEMNSFKLELHNIKSTPVLRTEWREPTTGNSSGNSSNNDGVDEARTTLIIHRTLNDAARRKRNVIVTGLPESDTHDDRSEFLRLCEENLTVKPIVSDNACIRIGKQLPNVPRRLLVRLSSEDVAVAVLKDAHRLRATASNVFINPDLSPAAAKLAYEARKKRRELKQRQSNIRVMDTAHDGEEINLPIIVTRSSPTLTRTADPVKTGSEDKLPTAGPITNVQALPSSSPGRNTQPNNQVASVAQTAHSFRSGLVCNQ